MKKDNHNNNELCWESLAALLCNFGIFFPLHAFSTGIYTWSFVFYIPLISLDFAFGISGLRHTGRKNKLMASASMVIPTAVIIIHIIVMILMWKYYVRYWNDVFNNLFS